MIFVGLDFKNANQMPITIFSKPGLRLCAWIYHLESQISKGWYDDKHIKSGKRLDSTVMGEMCLPPSYKSQHNSQQAHS